MLSKLGELNETVVTTETEDVGNGGCIFTIGLTVKVGRAGPGILDRAIGGISA
jgi:hypothetical protein